MSGQIYMYRTITRPWCGTITRSKLNVQQSTKIGEYVKNPRHPVLIMSYEMLIRSTDLMENLDIDLLVCDEGHRLKNNQVRGSFTNDVIF